MSEPCNQPQNCEEGEGCPSKCLDTESGHLQDSLPVSLVPTKPINNGFHRSVSYAQCSDDECGQRMQFTTMQGHEIRMMDSPSGASNITFTTADASQHIRLDEQDKIMWFTSSNHHMVFADNTHNGKVRYEDPNQLLGSTYQLLQTEKKNQIWLADSAKCPRIHTYTTKGHEVLLLDHNESSPKGKIQITSYDKLMQIVMDVDSGDITIQNHNLDGNGNTGDIKIYAVNNIKLEAENQIWLQANKGFEITSSDGDWNQDISDINVNCDNAAQGAFEAVIPEIIRESVLTDLKPNS